MAIGIAALALAAVLLAVVLRLLTGALGSLNPKAGRGEPDPQFAEPAQGVTRPPELAGEGPAPAGDDDPSSRWDEGVQTPVDMTAEDLARQAEQEN